MKGQAKPCGLPCGQGKQSARPDLDTTIAGRAAGASDQVAPARLALREQPAECGRARETGVEDAVVDEGFWVRVFARRHRQREKQYTPDVQCVHLIGLLAAVVDAQVLQAAKIRVCSVCSANARSPWLVLISEGNLGQRYDVGG